MNYRNSEMKIDQLVSYLNEKKINLSPPFQRGHVWRVNTRRKLVQNMIEGKPIPAIFLYKQESGTRYLYNILDGKQRIESIILFIASGKGNLSIEKWPDYFFGSTLRKTAKFPIRMEGQEKTFVNLGEETVRDFAEYVIPTIEITLEDTTSLDHVISLFVDINQQGVAVSRFQIVKAIRSKDPLLRKVFDLIAVEERRREDEYYKLKNNDITAVLKTLAIIKEEEDSRTRIERMWQRLIELALFVKTKAHRKPSGVLRGLIEGKIAEKLTSRDIRIIRKTFKGLREAYRATSLGKSRFSEDATYFYDLITYLIAVPPPDESELKKNVQAFIKFSTILAGPKDERPGTLSDKIGEYVELTSKQTTDPSRRKRRQELLSDIIPSMPTLGNI